MTNARSRAARSRRHRRRAARTRRAETVPTRQTIARLRPDPLWVLLQRGTLNQEPVDAAHDIRAAFEQIASPVRMRAMRTMTTSDGTSFDMSKTFWGAILTGLSAVFGVFGVEISGAEQAVLVDSVATAGAVIGTILALYGRVRAVTRVGLRRA